MSEFVLIIASAGLKIYSMSNKIKQRRKTLSKNMGIIDRIVRTSLAAIIAVLYFTNQITGTAAIILGIIAIAFLLTSSIGFCPLYVPLKISTVKKKKK